MLGIVLIAGLPKGTHKGDKDVLPRGDGSFSVVQLLHYR
jgi:hypothetical protein